MSEQYNKQAEIASVAEPAELSEDILIGAEAISAFTGWKRRRVFHLAEKGEIPCFKVGGIIHARKSTLIRWIEQMESRSMANG